MNKTSFIFPGQGSQYAGMGRDLCEKYDAASRVFEEFSSVLGRDIKKLCFEGTDEDLKSTVNAQPAILAVSIAAYECLKSVTGIVPDYLAGHSLGEYSALYAAGVITLPEIIQLVQKRAELMSDAPPGNMTAMLGMSDENLAKMIREAGSEGIICAANYNTPEQTVISGETKAILKANDLAKQLGAKRVIPLAVSGAFHSPLMKPVAEKFSRFVSNVNINDACIPVVTNVDAFSTVDKAEFATKMVKQIYSSVYWKQSVDYMCRNGVTTFVEIGPGNVLSGMIKKINRSATVYNVSGIETLGKFLSEYKAEVTA